MTLTYAWHLAQHPAPGSGRMAFAQPFAFAQGSGADRRWAAIKRAAQRGGGQARQLAAYGAQLTG